MKRVTSLPMLAALAVTAAGTSAACSSEIIVNGEGGATTSANSSGAGGSAQGGAAPTTSNSSSNSSNSSSSSSSGGSAPVCGESAQLLSGCVEAPIWPWAPENATITGRLESVGVSTPGCFVPMNGDSANVMLGLGPELPNTVWLIVGTTGGPYTVGIAAPNLVEEAFIPGADIEVVLENHRDQLGTQRQWLSVSQNGIFIAGIGNNSTGTSSPVQMTRGPELCYEEEDSAVCGYGDQTMVVEVGGQSAELVPDETQPVGNLLVTNDHFFQLYDLGACNFSDPISFAIGAVAPPPPD